MYYVFNMKRLLIGIAIVCVCIGLCIGGNRIAETFKVGGREIPIYSVERDDNKIALTFNCAWNDSDIDRIIDILKKYNVNATFFAVGDWAEKYPEALKKLSGAGFEIGNHSYNHAHYSKMSKQEIIEDIDKCDKIIEEITQKPVKLFRAAYGEYTDDVITACDETGRIYIQWSTDSLDYKAGSAEEIADKVLKNASPGDIILLHNGTKYTADALEIIIPKLLEEFTLVSVSELIYEDNYTIDASGRQHAVNNIN